MTKMLIIIFVLTCYYSLIESLSVDPIIIEKYIDDSQHKINQIGITYTQHVSNNGMLLSL